MTDPSNLPRVYGDKEIGRILKRATELQLREPSAPPMGVTLDELEEIAREAGIDPTYLRRAALDVDAGRSEESAWNLVLGDEWMLVREVTIPGELPSTGFERIVETIQSNSREHGQPSLLGRTLTWRSETAGKQRTMQIVVTSRDGSTLIRLEENLSQMAAGLFGGVTTGVGVGVGVGVGLPIAMNVLGSVAFAVAAPIGVTALSYMSCRWIYKAVVNRRRRQIADLFDRIVATAEAGVAPTSTPGEERSLGA